MLTRCPHCQTTFRVAPEQLKARLGQVRCGTCRGVFNAIDSLADEVPVVIVPTAEAVETPPEPILETATEAAAKPEPEPEPEPASSATPEDDSPPPPAEPGDEATAVAAATETMS
ncbi:MAG: zinc-ribbon domain-containing protein, partial [Rhodocyclaceae bacterium]|nr:zinc-ribbon domain-containing protein [Rhodocyclaceae bacterium]